MGTRGNDQEAPRQPLLSSLVVRPSEGGGGASRDSGVVNFESGDFRRHQHPNSNHDYYDYRGRRHQPGSISPLHHRDGINQISPEMVRDDGASRNGGFGNGRDSGRYRDLSPPYSRERDFRFDSRPYDRSARVSGPIRGDGPPRNNPNVRPREGDWICIDPSCKNLNFARRERCNNCNRPRYMASSSPRRGYSSSSYSQHQHSHAAIIDSPPRRPVNGGYLSPPSSWQRDGIPRDFRPTGQPNRHGSRVADSLRINRASHLGTDPRDRYGYDHPMSSQNYFSDRRDYGRLSPSPAAVASRDWPYARIRSRSPVRAGPPPKKYHHDVYMDQRRSDRRNNGRDLL